LAPWISHRSEGIPSLGSQQNPEEPTAPFIGQLDGIITLYKREFRSDVLQVLKD
jgi:hypothetical protein